MDFEESLREHADRFTLIPTRKVWIGLYNDLHPGSKWPSITMGFLLIFSIVMVGNLNNATKFMQPTILPDTKPGVAQNKISLNNMQENKNPVTTVILGSVETHPTKLVQFSSKKNQEDINEKKLGADLYSDSNNSSEIAFEDKKVEKTKSADKFIAAEAFSILDKSNEAVPNNSGSDLENSTVFGNQLPGFQKNINREEISGVEATFLETSQDINPVVSIENSLIMNIHADNNSEENVTEKKLLPKKNHKSTWTFYVDPSISSAWYTGAPISQSSISYSSPLMVNSGNISGNRKYGARLSLSAGALSSLPINGKLNFTSGLMLTYIGYKTTSSFIHPTFANLVLKDKTGNSYLKSYITHYGNSSDYGQLQLNNYSLQFAVPLGLQLTLLENQKLNWKIGSSMAPSVVLASQAYILSSDGRNYVTDPGLLRRFNLLATFETFVTLKSAKVKWQIGPSFGYQALSTFKSAYTEKEHLLDYGIKIGISR